MDLDLCRRSLLSGEKRSREGESSCRTSTAASAREREFRKHMLSSLCSVPLDQLDGNAQLKSLLRFGRPQTDPRPSKVPRHVDPFAVDFLRAFKLSRLDDTPGAAKVVADRHIPVDPYKVLDAPDLLNDFYLNLFSWSKDNVLAVGLAAAVYLWEATTGSIETLVDVSDEGDYSNYISSVKWCPIPGQTHYIAVGTKKGFVFIFDAKTKKAVRTLRCETGERIDSLAWNVHRGWLTFGTYEGSIVNTDTRMPSSHTSRFSAQDGSVCGLAWDAEGSCLASGSNDNTVCLWDASMSNGTSQSASRPRSHLKAHTAAVKALDWCPLRRGLLASGGGSRDGSIKLWNSASGTLVCSVATDNQVSSLRWSKTHRELYSGHGYSSNKIFIWRYPSMTLLQELSGHEDRVLGLDLTPDECSLVSLGADESVRFWDIGNCRKTSKQLGFSGDMVFGGFTIR